MLRFILGLVCMSLGSVAAAQTVSSPEQLIAAMHTRYSAKWYHTLTFEQQSITHKPDGTESTEIWHEALWLPGRLRIEIGDPQAGKGMLFVKNHLYVFREGKLASDRAYIHPLLVLGFDVYTQPIDATMQQLRDLHFELSSMHEESFNGRATYVVVAKSGDLHSLQFWIDKERLYFVRLIEPSEKPPGAIQDIRFEDYEGVAGGGWIAKRVAVLSDAKLVFEERYSDLKINPELKKELFDPKLFVQNGSAAPK
jgi:hypothetical protein